MTDPLRPTPTRHRPTRPAPARLAMAACATALVLGVVGYAAVTRAPAPTPSPTSSPVNAAHLLLQTGCPAPLRPHGTPTVPAPEQ